MASLTEPYVTALLVQTSLYGLYMATFGVCIRWLLFADEGWRLRKPLDWPMLIATVLIFTSLTTWLGANVQLTMESVRAVKSNLYVLGAVTIAASNVAILVTDAVMIYRCWKVYNKSWRITILPVLFWHGCIICTIMVFYYNHQLIQAMTMEDLETWDLKSTHAHAAFYPFNAATNIYTTAAIIYRVMHDAKTGSLYTLTTIPPIVGFFLDANKYIIVLFVTEAVNVSMAGIAFNLVLIRVGQSRADASSGQLLDSQATDRRRLLSGRHYHSSSTQGQSITEKGTISTTSTHGGGVATH